MAKELRPDEFDKIDKIDKVTGKCYIINSRKNEKILFKGKPFVKIEVTNISKVVFADTNEFISVKIDVPSKTVTSIENEELTEEDLKRIYGNDQATITKVKIENIG